MAFNYYGQLSLITVYYQYSDTIATQQFVDAKYEIKDGNLYVSNLSITVVFKNWIKFHII